MLTFNLKKWFKIRGIQNPKKFLIQFGFSENQAQRLIKFSPYSLRLSTVFKLCLALRCTPNDLIELRPSNKHPVPENHPLLALMHVDFFNPLEIADNIPPDKLKSFKSAVEEIKSKL